MTWADESTLRRLYIDERMDCVQIGRKFSKDPKTVWYHLRRFGIPTRPRGSDKRQQFPKGHVPWTKGRRMSDEFRQKIRETTIARGGVPYLRNGQHWLKGQPPSANGRWLGGVTPERQEFYRSVEWKAACATFAEIEVPQNVWIGSTVVNQAEADRDILKLLRVPARVRFLSVEPMLGPINTDAWLTGPNEIAEGYPRSVDWVICGGESGPHARPMQDAWARSLKDQCQAAGTAFFMKQMGGSRDKRGALNDLPVDLRVREFPCVAPNDAFTT